MFTNFNQLKQQLSLTLRDQLTREGGQKGLTTFADPAAFVESLGHPPTLNNRFFNSTLNRVQVWSGTTWLVLGG